MSPPCKVLLMPHLSLIKAFKISLKWDTAHVLKQTPCKQNFLEELHLVSVCPFLTSLIMITEMFYNFFLLSFLKKRNDLGGAKLQDELMKLEEERSEDWSSMQRK